ncbi:unnamed protein product [Amaranthus hypochondriacus]
MAMAIYPPYKANEGSVNYPRDASFSSYLDTAERDFVRTLAESINSPSPARQVSTPRTSLQGRNTSRAQRSGELDVFGAESYFNENLDGKKGGNSPVTPRKGGGGGSGGNHNKHHKHRREKRDDNFSLGKKSPSIRSNISTITNSNSLKSPTPSLKSEISWNSQIGLFLPKKGSVGHKIFSGFQCRGSCFDKKSVYTTKTTHQMSQLSTKYQAINSKNAYRKSRISHQDHFAFPIIDTASLNLDQPRKSVEVFGVHQLEKQEIERNIEKKLSILAWDAIPNSNHTISLTNKSSPYNSTVRTEDFEDVCSDASSDLFEIENLSGFHGSQTPSTPYYEPSEGSIEWSVVTASAADNFSAFSDYDDEKISIRSTRERTISKNISNDRRKMQRSSNSGGIFLGCTSHKAVDVVGNYNLNLP